MYMSVCDVILAIPPVDFSLLNSVNGRRTRRAGYYLYYPPLGLCSIAGSLRAAGFGAAIMDGGFEDGWPAPLLRRVQAENPAIVGLLVTTPGLPVSFQTIRSLRELKKKKGLRFEIVVGGPHISCDPEIVTDLDADYGVAGDGEDAVVKLAALLINDSGELADIPGLIWRQDETLKMNPPAAHDAVAAYPPPDRSLLDTRLYFNPFTPAPTTTAISARGCPFQCLFCSRSASMGAYRPRPVDAVLDEMHAIRDAGYGFVSVIDETFTFDRERAAALCEGMLRLGPGFKWSCQTRIDTMDDETLSLLRRAGCVNISFGVEAGQTNTRNQMGKPFDDTRAARVFAACRRLGISTNAFFMIGNPGEAAADVREGVAFAQSLRPDYAVFNIATLLPGSIYYQQLVEAGKIKRDVWPRYMRGEVPLPLLSESLDKPQLVALLNEAYRAFYLRPEFILRRLSALRSPRQAWHLARQGMTVIGDYVLSAGAR
jgi:radical SAM superfamily enzyme YgiQ (UPF0313 family)